GLKRGLDTDPEVRRRVAGLRNRVIQEELLDRYVRARVTEEAVQERYRAYLEQNPAVRGVSARHILVETEAEAWEVIAELKAGADFVELAKTRSIGPSAADGGNLGHFRPDEVMREISDAAFGMQPGTFSEEPVESPFGWHVIKVEEVRKVEPLSYEKVRDELVTALSKQVIAELIEELRRDARITRFNIDGTTAPEGMFDPPAGLGAPGAPAPATPE
ncbi:MAG: peptidylprolyl isomerase, partial [Kiloniellales bacterium]